MVSSVALAIWLIVSHIPGRFTTVSPRAWRYTSFLSGRFRSRRWLLECGQKFTARPYTIASALIASTFITMSTHGTDQDMVQRMLTATDFRKSRLSLITSGLADLPIATSFLLVGILLWVFYKIQPDSNLPAADNEIFRVLHYYADAGGIARFDRGGGFATMMGSTSAALTALATSFTKDFFLPYFPASRLAKNADLGG